MAVIVYWLVQYMFTVCVMCDIYNITVCIHALYVPVVLIYILQFEIKFSLTDKIDRLCVFYYMLMLQQPVQQDSSKQGVKEY